MKPVREGLLLTAILAMIAASLSLAEGALEEVRIGSKNSPIP